MTPDPPQPAPPRRGRAVAPLAVLALLGVAGCSTSGDSTSGSATPSPFAACSALAAPSPAAQPTDLPDLQLPCFTGDTTVALRGLPGPAVINVWASYCSPCRQELPVMQRLADRAGDRLTVLGVDSGDVRGNGASFATDKGVTMPTLFDADKKLLGAVAAAGMPITIFLDAAGRSYVNRLPLDETSLPAAVRKHTGVAVTL